MIRNTSNHYIEMIFPYMTWNLGWMVVDMRFTYHVKISIVLTQIP